MNKVGIRRKKSILKTKKEIILKYKNKSILNSMKSQYKNILHNISNNDCSQDSINKVISYMNKIRIDGYIHKNKMSRMLSKLMLHVNASNRN